MKIRFGTKIISCILLLGLVSCGRDAMEDSHFIYFSPTEPYLRIGAVECVIDQVSGEIRNVEPIPGNMDITAMPVYFVTNHKHNGVYVNGVAQKSGVTVNDFSTPVTYEVHSEAGVRSYVVTLTNDPACWTQAAVQVKSGTELVKTIDDEQEVWLDSKVRQSIVDFTTPDSRKLRLCLLEADMSDGTLDLRTLLPDDGTAWGLQTIAEQAGALEVAGTDVLCAINGDTFDAFSGTPDGLVIKESEILNVMDSRWYIGIRDDGRISIGDSEDFFVVEKKITNAIGASKVLIEKGGLVPGIVPDNTLKSRTAAGMDSFDLKKLYFVVIQSLGQSEGVTLDELVDCLLALKLGHAVSLSDGASASYVSLSEGLLVPVNKNNLQPVANGIALVRK